MLQNIINPTKDIHNIYPKWHHKKISKYFFFIKFHYIISVFMYNVYVFVVVIKLFINFVYEVPNNVSKQMYITWNKNINTKRKFDFSVIYAEARTNKQLST